MGHEALNFKGFFHEIFMACSPLKTNENSPSKSLEKIHWIFMGFNFIVYGSKEMLCGF